MHAHKVLYILSDSEDSEDENPEKTPSLQESSVNDPFQADLSLLSERHEDYQHTQIVYKGNFSTLELVKHKQSGQNYMIKWIPRSNPLRENLVNMRDTASTFRKL
ncbi:hypothetical protein D915_004758 [Fasciola hepatica]|uniref:Uncharacterized protein n=1 Tax=Fasciola hepatica TaxID=6192 RepID=A0A4E0S1G3_FASHE|nr:hypothetical protein D915_004758 [Fasciola hepatica]